MVEADLTVEEVMRRWPRTLAVFVRLKLNCVGCDMARFETLADVARTYQLTLSDLLAQLSEVALEVES